MPPIPYYDDGQIVIYLGDCREILPTLAPVDLVLTDPPYGIGGIEINEAYCEIAVKRLAQEVLL